MNHSGDANKMVDTPRADAHIDGLRRDPEVSGCDRTLDFARQLERELNAANQRIKRLEDWKEWALAVEREWNANAIATMLGGQPGESQRKVIQREVPKLLERIKRLEDGDAALTYSIGLDLQKENEALKARIQRLVEAGDALKASGYFGGWADAVNKWNKAKEDKP